MRSGILTQPKRVLVTLDAVGGIWRYAVDLALALDKAGIRILLVGAGPSAGQARIAACIGSGIEIIWTDLPLDWMCDHPEQLADVPAELMRIAKHWRADLLHLNQPAQAAGLSRDLPVLVAAHSCVVTWWRAARDEQFPESWFWQRRLNLDGLTRADLVVTPSRSHAAAVRLAYGPLPSIQVVYHASTLSESITAKGEFVLSAGRWWDDGKNGRTLDQAAALSSLPVLIAGPLVGPNGERAVVRHAEHLGDLSASDMAHWMRQAPIFAAPSLYEPFGLAVLEAAANGAALVLADIPTFRELWHDAALFVPARNAAAFADAFDALTKDMALRARMAGLARQRAGTFSRQRQSDAMLQTYRVATERHASLEAVVVRA